MMKNKLVRPGVRPVIQPNVNVSANEDEEQRGPKHLPDKVAPV